MSLHLSIMLLGCQFLWSVFFCFERVSASDPVNRLRSILTEKNKDAFTNPRDPVTLNVVKAFANYDRNR